MTCQEFAAITDQDFFEITIAERTAARKHARACPECMSALEQKALAELPKADPEDVRLLLEEAYQQLRRDALDPEAQL